MGTITTEYQAQLSPLLPPRWVQLLSKGTGGVYVSQGPSDGISGTAIFAGTVPNDTYTLKTGPSPNGPWTTEDSNYVVASNPPTGKITDQGGMTWDVTHPKYGAGDITKVSAAVSTAGINQAIIDANAAGGGTVWLPPQPNGYGLIRYQTGTYAQKGGGILLLPRVSLLGQDTKLLLRDNAAFITNKGAHNYLPTIATIQANIVIGDTNLLVDSSAGFVVGDNIYVSPSQNQYDTSSSGFGYFAVVQAIPDGTHITVDRPAPLPMFMTLPAAPTLSDGGAGTLPAGSYTIGFTYLYGSGAPANETVASPTSVQVIAINHQIGFASVALPAGVYAIRWYIISNTAGATNGFVLQQTVAAAGNINVQGNGVAAPDKGIALSTPVDGGFPANGGNYYRRIIRLDNFYSNCSIGGFDFINDIANGGNAEFAIDLRFARDILVTNLTGQDIGAGYQASFCDGVSFKNWEVRQSLAQGGASYKGRGAGDFNNNRQVWEDGKIQAFDGTALFVESYTKAVQFKKLRIVNNSPNARISPTILHISQEAEVELNGVLLEGYGGTWQGQPYDLTDDGGTPQFLTVKDLEMRLAQDWRTCRLDIVSGKLILGPASPVAGYYVEAKRWSKRFALTKNMASFDAGLPSGLIKRLKVYISTLTGITYFSIGSLDKTGALQLMANMVGLVHTNQPPLAAGKSVDFSFLLGRIGTNYPANNSGLTKKTSINSDGTVPDGAYCIIEMEYFVQAAQFPSSQQSSLAADDLTKALIEDGGLLPGTAALGDFRRSTQTVTLAGGTVTIDATQGELVKCALNASTTLGAPSNPKDGQELTFRFQHDNSANAYVITWNGVFKRAGFAFANTNAAFAIDQITFIYDATFVLWLEKSRAINVS